MVGWVALAEDSEWDPKAYFTLSRIFTNSADSVLDERLGLVRTKDDYYPFPQFKSKAAWLDYRRKLKDHFLVTMGAYPQPVKTPLNPRVFDRIEREGYTIEKACFESLPGFYTTGTLYRPKGKEGPFPAILCPHGHWGDGRLAHVETNSIPGRCINFARQGYVVFAIDMIGYLDSNQLDHKFGGRPEWLWGLTLHGLQYWNSVRAIDFLLGLDDVDPDRIGLTGASGGGTQTYGLMATDNRIKVAAPVNMISAHFQGGCLCENAANLRIWATNLEFSALMTPRPLMMIAATGDWTSETPRVEFPAMRTIYELFDAADRVASVQIDAPHNYNQHSREPVYAWFGKWLLGDDDPDHFKEQPFTLEDPETMRLFPDGPPEGALKSDELVEQWIESSETQLREVFPSDKTHLRALRFRAGTALRHVLGANKPDQNELAVERLQTITRKTQDGLFIEKVILGRKGKGDRIPGILLVPSVLSDQAIGTLLVHEKGKAAFIDEETGKPDSLLQGLLDAGHTVFLPDLFMTGEHDSPFEKAERDKNTSHYLTYNQTETALRVQDVLTSLAYLQSRYEVDKVNLIGEGQAGLWALLAASLEKGLNAVAADTDDFDLDDDEDYLETLYVPGLRRVGDLRTAQAMIAPSPLLLHNTKKGFDTEWATEAYHSVGVPDLLETKRKHASGKTILQWLKNY